MSHYDVNRIGTSWLLGLRDDYRKKEEEKRGLIRIKKKSMYVSHYFPRRDECIKGQDVAS